jgi:hypothetical protein
MVVFYRIGVLKTAGILFMPFCSEDNFLDSECVILTYQGGMWLLAIYLSVYTVYKFHHIL